MEKCWRCGKELICQGDFMISDWEGIDMDDDDDAMITDYYCPFCGIEYSVTDTPKNQEKNYAYFNMKDEGYAGNLFENDEVFNKISPPMAQ